MYAVDELRNKTYNDMDLEQQYEKEKGYSAKENYTEGLWNGNYTDEYVEWLEDKLANSSNDIQNVSESLPCVMSPECEIIKICVDEDVANKEMEEFKKQHGGEWYVDDVRIQK